MFSRIDNEQGTPHQKPSTTRNILRVYLYAVILCTFIAIINYTIGFAPFLPGLIVSLSYGLSTCTMIFFLEWLFKPEEDNNLKSILILMAGVVCGTIIGWNMGLLLIGYFFPMLNHMSGRLYFANLVFALVLNGMIINFFYSKKRLKYIKEIAEKERLNRLTSEKEALEANLRLLQAQIEPHFLFNTLSNILSLIDTEPSKGKSMLMDLIHFLRTSLSRTLPEMTTLGQEVDALKAYLNIQKIRLGDRLAYTINVDEALNKHPFPPMLLQPLVENSIKHGLEPKVEGGQINIAAAKENGTMRITVADTGLGFSSLNKTGVGVANVKERIRLLYGDKGRFILEENNPVGVIAVIEVPRDELQSNHS
jgi:sensor histidine kinase YesM